MSASALRDLRPVCERLVEAHEAQGASALHALHDGVDLPMWGTWISSVQKPAQAEKRPENTADRKDKKCRRQT